MSLLIDTTEKVDINLTPETVEEEVMQNLWFLYSSIEYDVPLDRALGLNATFIDKPIETAKALATTDIYEKTEKYEPRAEIQSISFSVVEDEYKNGILKPIVEVAINGEYDNEDDTE